MASSCVYVQPSTTSPIYMILSWQSHQQAKTWSHWVYILHAHAKIDQIVQHKIGHKIINKIFFSPVTETVKVHMAWVIPSDAVAVTVTIVSPWIKIFPSGALSSMVTVPPGLFTTVGVDQVTVAVGWPASVPVVIWPGQFTAKVGVTERKHQNYSIICLVLLCVKICPGNIWPFVLKWLVFSLKGLNNVNVLQFWLWLG